jgi:hypothetical protein
VRKVALLVTDGAPYTNVLQGSAIRTLTTQRANVLKALDVTIVGVGVAIASDNDQAFLRTLATRPDLYFNVSTFNLLPTLIGTIMLNVCCMYAAYAAAAAPMTRTLKSWNYFRSIQG